MVKAMFCAEKTGVALYGAQESPLRGESRSGRRNLDTIERTYSACSWMTDEAFRDAIGDAVDTFLGKAPTADIF